MLGNNESSSRRWGRAVTLGQRKQPIMSRALVKTLRNAEQAKAIEKKRERKKKKQSK